MLLNFRSLVSISRKSCSLNFFLPKLRNQHQQDVRLIIPLTAKSNAPIHFMPWNIWIFPSESSALKMFNVKNIFWVAVFCDFLTESHMIMNSLNSLEKQYYQAVLLSGDTLADILNKLIRNSRSPKTHSPKRPFLRLSSRQTRRKNQIQVYIIAVIWVIHTLPLLINNLRSIHPHELENKMCDALHYYQALITHSFIIVGGAKNTTK